MLAHDAMRFGDKNINLWKGLVYFLICVVIFPPTLLLVPVVVLWVLGGEYCARNPDSVLGGLYKCDFDDVIGCLGCVVVFVVFGAMLMVVCALKFGPALLDFLDSL